MRRVLVISAAVLAAAGVDAAVNTNPKARLAAAARVVRGVQLAVPTDYWYKARCVAVFPELKNTEFVVGGKYGRGVMSCRTGEGWSAPAFVEIEKGGRMFQMGAQQVDFVLLLMNEGPAQTLLQQKVTLGADASIAPGPIDSQAHVDLTTLRADILSYSQAKGLYLNLAGGVLAPDGDLNRDVYGKEASLRTILANSDLSAPVEAQGFIAALSTQPAPTIPLVHRRSAPSAPAATAATTVPAAVPRAADSDLRARVIALQQTLDRVLGDTPPPVPVSTVGTSGTVVLAQPAAVTVDRARLMQMRQQLDAILAALNGR
jgi:SH3 domain-containing YSC84-like protein 1